MVIYHKIISKFQKSSKDHSAEFLKVIKLFQRASSRGFLLKKKVLDEK
jgi:hypothetical protein